MSKSARTLLIISCGMILLMFLMQTRPSLFGGQSPEKLNYSQFLTKIEGGSVLKGTFEKNRFNGEYANNGGLFFVELPKGESSRRDLEKLLVDNKVQFEYVDTAVSDMIMQIGGWILVFIIILVVFWLIMNKTAQAGSSQAFSFGKARARRYNESVPKVTFSDVAGVEEAKIELAEVVDYLKNTKKYQSLGAKIPKGILLLGPPGCGKTLLARAVAGEAGVPFFHISGSDFVEMFVGVGAARVRDLFENAKANRPALIFIDEIDAVGRLRGAGLGGGHDEREQTLNQLLVEMDGFDPNIGIIMIAATNRPDILDPALLRPGRFDRQVVVDPPDQKGRQQILEVHMRGKPLARNVNSEVLSKRSPGFTGADLANLVNEAALLAARRDKTKIEMDDFDEAIDRVLAGPQRRSRTLDEKERQIVAYHEVGHAIVGELVPHGDPVHKVSILPRGMALGYTINLPDSDKRLSSKARLTDMIAGLLGGRIAEEIVFGDVSTGASNDLERATELARAMATEYGMSEKLGPLTFGRRHGNPFLGRDLMEDRNYSEQVAFEIDQEVRQIVESAYERARSILIEHKDKMDFIVQALLERENLNREEFLELLGMETPHSNDKPPTAPKVAEEPDEEEEEDTTQTKVRLRPRAQPG